MTQGDPRPVGLILAGGLARRFGGQPGLPVDKALLRLDRRPLLAHLVDRLAPQCAALWLNANGDPRRFADFGLPVLPDAAPGHPGPLAGLLAGFARLGAAGAGRPDPARWLVTAPADTPFLPRDFVARLQAAQVASGVALAAARSAGRAHWLCALWSADLAARLERALGSDDRRLSSVYAGIDHCLVDFPDLPVDPFLNINDADDLAAAGSVLPTLR